MINKGYMIRLVIATKSGLSRTLLTGDSEVCFHISAFNPQVDTFMRKYEDECTPVVIRGIPQEEKWGAWAKWSLPQLMKDNTSHQSTFKVKTKSLYKGPFV